MSCGTAVESLLVLAFGLVQIECPVLLNVDDEAGLGSVSPISRRRSEGRLCGQAHRMDVKLMGTWPSSRAGCG